MPLFPLLTALLILLQAFLALLIYLLAYIALSSAYKTPLAILLARKLILIWRVEGEEGAGSLNFGVPHVTRFF
jgi:hypothetical protein